MCNVSAFSDYFSALPCFDCQALKPRPPSLFIFIRVGGVCPISSSLVGSNPTGPYPYIFLNSAGQIYPLLNLTQPKNT